MALREVLALFSIDVDTSKLEKANTKVDTFIGQLEGLGKAFIGFKIVQSIANFVDENIKAGAAVYDLGQKLGIETDALQQFAYSAELAGVQANSLGVGIKFFNRVVGDAIEGGKASSKVLGHLGISFRDANGNVKETADLLPEVADKFSKLKSEQEKTYFMVKLFGREGARLIPVMAQGSEALREQAKEFKELGGGMSKVYIAAAKEAYRQTVRVKTALSTLTSEITLFLLPGFQKGANWLIKWIKIGQDYVKTTNIMVAATVALGISFVLTLAKMAGSVGKLILSFGKFFLIAAIIIFVSKLIEDFYTMMIGGKSVIGDFIEGFAGVEGKAKFIEEINKNLAQMKAALKEIGKAFTQVDADGNSALTDLLGLFGSMLKAALFFAESLNDIGAILGDVVSQVVALFSGDSDAMQVAGQDKEEHYQNMRKKWDAVFHPPTTQDEANAADPSFIGPFATPSAQKIHDQGVINTINDNSKTTVNVDARGMDPEIARLMVERAIANSKPSRAAINTQNDLNPLAP